MPETTHTTAHLQLCVNDLLHPTEKSESLLEALTPSQLEEIEKTLVKIKARKQSISQNSHSSSADTTALLDKQQQQQQQQQQCELASSNTPQTSATHPSNLHHDWTMVAAQIAKALADNTTTPVNTNNTSNMDTKDVKKEAMDKPPTSSKSDDASSPAAAPAPAPALPKSNSSTPSHSNQQQQNVVTNHEPRTEIRDGIEWVSFVYSHHRVLRRYSIRTDIDQVDISLLDDKFKSENCVYPRANLSREEYKGNRWAYETECNTLGWKLAFLNTAEIAGKRGLIQRAVDSYRNRYPSMRSRRVARQEKLLKGTLRKRKQRDASVSEASDEPLQTSYPPSKKLNAGVSSAILTPTSTATTSTSTPKTVTIDDGHGQGGKYRVRINVDSVSLDSIDMAFRKANCVYPRAIDINTSSPFASQRQLEEARCNELGWKLAWLNPKQLANRKNLLQRVLDVYRTKFMPELNPRKNSIRIPFNPPNRLSIDTTMLTAKSKDMVTPTPLTAAALAAQQLQEQQHHHRRHASSSHQDSESLYSGTTDSLDFHDCFSSRASSPDKAVPNISTTTPPASSSSSSTSPSLSNQDILSPHANELMLSSSAVAAASTAQTYANEDGLWNFQMMNQHYLHPLFNENSRLSISSTTSTSSTVSNASQQHDASPSASPFIIKSEDAYLGIADPMQIDMDESSAEDNNKLFKDTHLFDFYTEHMLPSSAVNGEEVAADQHTLMNQLFQL